MVERKESWFQVPNPLVGHHDLCATRTYDTLQFPWFIAMRLSPLDSKVRHGRSGTNIWVVRTRTREREVELDGHGEVNSWPEALPTWVGFISTTTIVL
jgi:hypothetical protein